MKVEISSIAKLSEKFKNWRMLSLLYKPKYLLKTNSEKRNFTTPLTKYFVNEYMFAFIKTTQTFQINKRTI